MKRESESYCPENIRISQLQDYTIAHLGCDGNHRCQIVGHPGNLTGKEQKQEQDRASDVPACGADPIAARTTLL